ncbi:glutamate-1-semialdehyde 2,1-aminomutase [Thalassospira lucentensis]|uniref:glutamate-1-semialdehyde 2,1-aminomutase n=1 Tax=Thalassospira lucentensis TaxID=168935 RepID=UPI003D28EE02
MKSKNHNQRLSFEKSSKFERELELLVPGGAHTYSKGRDQFPSPAPNGLTKASGALVWDADGNELIDWSMGLGSVSIGHADSDVNSAVFEAILTGVNSQRPFQIELEAAQLFCEKFETDMVKFARHGSSVTTAAIKLARAFTGKRKVVLPKEHPFFSFDDWFISTTEADFGIPSDVEQNALPFSYNNIAQLESIFERNSKDIACLIMEVVKFDAPNPGFLERVRELCDEHGIVLIFDEMVSGLKFPGGAASKYFGIEADLYTFGKGVANGFAFAALAGRRELMELGGIAKPGARKLFMLSSTHGGETVGLAAMIATLRKFHQGNLIQQNWTRGEDILHSLNEIISSYDLGGYVNIIGYPTLMAVEFKGPDTQPSPEFRTLFLQEMLAGGCLFQGLFMPTSSHTSALISKTLRAFDAACSVYRNALTFGSVEGFLDGPAVKPVFRRYV